MTRPCDEDILRNCSDDDLLAMWRACFQVKIPSSDVFCQQRLTSQLEGYLHAWHERMADMECLRVIHACSVFAQQIGVTLAESKMAIADVVACFLHLKQLANQIADKAGILNLDWVRRVAKVTDGNVADVTEGFCACQTRSRSDSQWFPRRQQEWIEHNLIDSSAVMMWVTDRHSKCFFLSKSWYVFTGRTPEQDLGQGWFELVHPDDREEAQRVYTQKIASRQQISLYYRLKHHSGEYRRMLEIANPKTDQFGEYDGYVGTVLDVQDSFLAERQVKEKQQRFWRAAESIGLGIWFTDFPFDVFQINAEVARHLFLAGPNGCSKAEFYAAIHPDDRSRVRTAAENAVYKKDNYSITYRTLSTDGSNQIKYILAIGWAEHDAQGHPVRFDGITLDVSESAREYNQSEQGRVAAEAANDAKSAFLAHMSHEIRTPLGAIMGFADLAGQNRTSAVAKVNYLNVIQRNCKQVLRIIDDILDLAKVESGRIEFETSPVHLPKFLGDFAEDVGLRAEEKGIGFFLRAETSLPETICTDATRLRQILTNAIGNAIKFTARGKITVYLAYRQNKLSFRIVDTGRGISAQQAGRLFEAFVQADASTTRKYGGSGLGLVLTKRLCREMGGDYTLESSQMHRGSCFVATICVSVPTKTRIIPKSELSFEASNQAHTDAVYERLDKVHVLIVEDSEDNCTLIQEILHHQGATSDLAANGAIGLEKALQTPYDIVILDVQMPIMDGHQVVRRMRYHGLRQPTIALTAHAMPEEAARAQKSGFDAFLAKPIDAKKLIGMMHHLLHRQEQTRLLGC